MNHYPDTYQDWLFEALDLKPGDECLPEILEPLYGLNRQWVHTDRVMDYDADEALMRSYSLYYMTINMPKLWHILDNAHSKPRQPVKRVIEFGCGPGTFLWAYLFYLEKVNPAALETVLQVKGIDRSPAALAVAERLAVALKRGAGFNHIEFSFELGDWSDHLDDPADLAIFGNVLNEGADTPWGERTIPFDNVVIIEPGTSKIFPTLLTLRQQFMESGRSVAFPCTTWQNECPMHGTDNWCHFSINRFSLPFIQRMSGKAKRLNPRHNFCGFFFVRDESVSEDPTHWRCVSRMRKVHRSGIRWLCNGCRLEEAVLTRHSRSDGNRPFLTAELGDRISIQPPLRGTRLSPKSTVAIVTGS
jgi:SAM-dependent methyltransferase